MKKKTTTRETKSSICKTMTVSLPSGEKKRLYFYGKTEKEVQQKLDEAKLLCKMGLLTFNSNTPLRRWAEEYFEIYMQSSSSFNRDLLWNLLERILLNDAGCVQVGDVKPALLKAALNKVSNQSKSQYDKAYAILFNLFSAAAENGLITANPMIGIKKEKKTGGNRRSLTNREREICMQTFATHEKGLLFALMFYCGLRPGEARAMTWNNIDMENKTITVTQAVKKTGNTGCAGIKLGAPKTESSTRTIPMPQRLIELLKPAYKKGFEYVVPGETGQPISEQRYNRAWDSFYREMQIAAGAKLYRNAIAIFADDIGQDITPYCLRHTYATRLAEKKVDIKVAMKLMGHTTPNMLMLVYQHVSENLEKNANAAIVNLYDEEGKDLAISVL